jgi:light-harvesting protein B-800-850 alpha chain
MINSKMWLVVKPTVGLPLFFIGVIVAALSVHLALLLNTTWFAAYWQGSGARAPMRTSELVVPQGASQVTLPAEAAQAGVVLIRFTPSN